MLMVKFKKKLLKKEDGYSGYYIIALVFFILMTALTLVKVEERKVKLVKNQLDNAVILSAMSANVADLYQYATFKTLALDSMQGKKGAYGKNSTTEIETGTKAAYKKAYDRYKSALKVNAHLNSNLESTNKLYSNFKTEKFIIYNVFSDKVYSYDGINFTNIGSKGVVKAPTGDVINASGIYVKASVDINALGQSFNRNINEYVDICIE